jgi:autophagy-related protein 2
MGSTRLRVHDASVTVNLHDGYDYPRTRKLIEDEIRAVRRRLERIRQLLASGQKADSSVESETASVLFNSVYIGIEPHKLEGGSAGLLAAIDEELDGLAGEDTASQNSWQTNFPASALATTRKSSSTRLRGRRLTRSRKPQIEITLSGIKADLDLFTKEEETASRLEVTVKSAEILDHIKSSTWKKFLTEMKADSRGNVRETDADMIRVQLVGVRPSVGSEVENRLRVSTGSVRVRGKLMWCCLGQAKFLPLRLHIDQDALDFLKRFFAFSAPPVLQLPTKRPSSEPFFRELQLYSHCSANSSLRTRGDLSCRAQAGLQAQTR